MTISSKLAVGVISLALLAGFSFAQEEGEVLGEYGPIVVKLVNGKRTAFIDTAKTTLDIPEDVEVDAIFYNRDYSGEWGKPGTLMLPFDFPSGCVSGAQIYEMTSISISGNNSWQIDTKNVGSNGEFHAHRPYFVRPHAKQLTFPDWCSKTTMKATNGDYIVRFDSWEFRGMYSYKKWEEGDSDLGYLYGFAAKDKVVDGKTIQEGQFVKGKAGASVRPFRAYLIYNVNSTAETPKSKPLAKTTAAGASMTASLTAEELPKTIDVIFHDEDGGTTAIHSLDPRTGEFTANKTGWYDMTGRKLDKRPTIKGNYFYNGNKVTIK